MDRISGLGLGLCKGISFHPSEYCTKEIFRFGEEDVMEGSISSSDRRLRDWQI